MNDLGLPPAIVSDTPIKPHLFIHIPKTAGISIKFVPGIRDSRHYQADWYRQRFPFKFQKAFKFSIVRNPFDRVVSAWEFVRAKGLGLGTKFPQIYTLYDEVQSFGNSLEDFDEFCRTALVKMHYNWMEFRTQHWFLCSSNNILVDYVGRYETLQESWSYIAAQIGCRDTLDHRNINPYRQPYQKYYGKQSTIDAVLSVYHKDFSLFQYDTNLPLK